jgi:hypothetical protein
MANPSKDLSPGDNPCWTALAVAMTNIAANVDAKPIATIARTEAIPTTTHIPMTTCVNPHSSTATAVARSEPSPRRSN